ncbi:MULTISPECIES: hypothetical protein [Acinetobacter]|uniref:Uncharacterized protein n=3 Tax=Acinetobacter TaxID=469 RepID=S3TYY7_9GAMM|nr:MULTISPECIES: hypothetical protein [Acinetobacter]AWL21171.1 hypothetical protein DIW83_12895 [Acinetobacter nosocomialis]ENW07984.1 hypothetical protein F933_00510 [Acinetobacter beijerinckii CIP 110307]ENW81654.1 hypothetical protein F909_01338 [Acinetobacter sp. ANC 3929]ENX58707.1 hypothetical protein F902_01331 [Acinetobacter higginsii]EPG40825.1 hypothetical protein F907_00656 [Acinetobacter colistiniresistens]
MRSSRLSKLILAFILFLFTITITGVHAWAPVLLENIEHQHELSIVVEDDASSHWSLQHSGDSFTSMTDHDVETHTWKNFDEPIYHHSVKPISSDSDLSIDPVFILSFITALIFLFLKLSEHQIRVFDFRKRIFILRNSYTYTKALIVLRN